MQVDLHGFLVFIYNKHCFWFEKLSLEDSECSHSLMKLENFPLFDLLQIKLLVRTDLQPLLGRASILFNVVPQILQTTQSQ